MCIAHAWTFCFCHINLPNKLQIMPIFECAAGVGVDARPTARRPSVARAGAPAAESSCHAKQSSAASDASSMQRRLLQGMLELPTHHRLHICSFMLEEATLETLLTQLPAELHYHLLAAQAQGWQKSSAHGQGITKLSTQSCSAMGSSQLEPMSSQSTTAFLTQAAAFELSDLSICSCEVNTTAVMLLRAALRQSALTALELSQTALLADAPVAETLCSALQRLSSLRELRVSSCGPIGEQVRSALAATLGAMQLTKFEFSSQLAERRMPPPQDETAQPAHMQLGANMAEGLCKCTSLQQLTVTAEVAAVQRFAALQQLQHLRLQFDATFSDPEHNYCALQPLTHLTALTYLAIVPGTQDRDWAVIDDFEIAKLTCLQHLVLWEVIDAAASRNPRGHDAVPQLDSIAGLAHLTQLTHLSICIHDCDFDAEVCAPNLAASIQHLQQLQELTVEPHFSCETEQSEAHTARAAAQLPVLRAYKCSVSTSATMRAERRADASQRFTQLTALDIFVGPEFRNGSEADFKALFDGIAQIQGLRKLDMCIQMSAGRPQPSVALLLASITGLAFMQQMHLSGMQVKGSQDWAMVSHLTMLTVLTLSAMQQFTANGGWVDASCMLPIAKLPRLQKLVIQCSLSASTSSGQVVPGMVDSLLGMLKVMQKFGGQQDWSHHCNAIKEIVLDVGQLCRDVELLSRISEWAARTNVSTVRLRTDDPTSLQAQDVQDMCAAFNVRHAGRKRLVLQPLEARIGNSAP